MSKKQLNVVFLIAGSEPLGSAGMQADIKAITACGGYAACALTGIVDEDTRRVKSVTPLPVELVVSQAESFLGDVGAQCVKTGVLPTAEIIDGVAGVLKRYPNVKKVIDPVIVDSNGVQLVSNESIDAYKEKLFPMATLITPNFREAEGHQGTGTVGQQRHCEVDAEPDLCRTWDVCSRHAVRLPLQCRDGRGEGVSETSHPHTQCERHGRLVLVCHRHLSGQGLQSGRGGGERRGIYRQSHCVRC